MGTDEGSVGGTSSGIQQMKRPGVGTTGKPVSLMCNHFAVKFTRADDVAQYDVTISYEDDPNNKQIISKTLCRKVMAKLDFKGKNVLFDGERNLYALGTLPFKEEEYKVYLDGQQRPGASSSTASPEERSKKRRMDGKCFKIRIAFSVKVDMRPLEVLQNKREHLPKAQDALRVLDVLLKEQAARREYMLLRDSYFHESLGRVGDVGEGVVTWRGYHASFRPCTDGLSLNLDPSTTVIIKSQFVHQFLSEYLRKDINRIAREDLTKAKRILKNVEVQVFTGTKHKIFGFSDGPAALQSFELNNKMEDGSVSKTTITVEQYYQNRHKVQLHYPNLYCVNVGKASRPVYIPMEFCKILPGQRYSRKLSGSQVRKNLDEARQKPNERKKVINKGISELLRNSEDVLKSFNVQIASRMLQVQGRVLGAPSLKFGRNDETPRDGSWNYNTKTVAFSCKIPIWVVLSFGGYREADARQIAMQLKQCCNRKGININDPAHVFAEQPRFQGRSALDRVNEMLNEIKRRMKDPPRFILCILPEKDSDLYAPFKRVFLTQVGIVNQCMVPPPRQLNDQYLTNVALKINAKNGGYNSVLTKEFGRTLPIISRVPTMILGMDVSHGAPFSSNSPSVAAVVGSRDWPRITQFAARVMTQSPKQEAIVNLADGPNGGMIQELLTEFINSNEKREPPFQIIIFRDGVSESQFASVLTVELQEVLKACDNFKEGYRPKVTLIVAQKRHHTRFFPVSGDNNIEPGTVVDKGVCHPTDFDFFLSSQKGRIGTTRPTHYVVLHDENDFSPDEMQNTINQLCYTYVKSTSAISVVAPIFYAHLAAMKSRNFLDDDSSESGSSHAGSSHAGSSHAGMTSAGMPPVRLMPRVHQRIVNTMFFV